MRLLRGTAKGTGFGHGAEVPELMDLHELSLKNAYRQCLSIVSELYIGSIVAGALPFKGRWQKRTDFPRLRAR
jgi:hypothetical protein